MFVLKSNRVTLVLRLFLFVHILSTKAFSSDLDTQQKIAELILNKVELALEDINEGNDIELIVSEINNKIDEFNKLDQTRIYSRKSIKYSKFKKDTYFRGAKIPKYNGWDFSVGNTWMNKTWGHCASCKASDSCDGGFSNHFCQLTVGSVFCLGFIPCYPLQFFLSPLIPCYYQGGKCIKVGCPLETETDKTKLIQYLKSIKSALELFARNRENPPPSVVAAPVFYPSAPTNQELHRGKVAIETEDEKRG